MDKVEQLSVLDNSIFRKAAEKSPDHRYSSGDDKGFFENRHYPGNEQSSYNGKKNTLYIENNFISN
jgi:hypothetical protein